MFEQSVVESRRNELSGRRAATLPVSIAMHIIAVSGAVFAAVWNVDFPTAPPPQVEMFQPTVKPPEPSAAPRATPKPAARATIARRPDTPPTIISDKPLDEIAQLPAESNPLEEVLQGDGATDPPGSTDGIPGGQGTEPAQPDARVIHRPGGDVKPPVVLQRVDPTYPPLAVKMRIEGMAIVECIIDRNGDIQSVRSIHASHELFRAAAENAVAKWRFKPGTLNGRPVDVMFNLTVRFTLKS